MIDPDGMEPRGGEWLLDQALRKGHAALVWMTGSEENARATVVGVAELHPVVGLASGIDSAETTAGVGTAVALEALGPLADAAKWGSRLIRGGDDVAAGMGRVCSFHGDTLVLTAEGMKAISSIELSDLVWSRDPATGQMGWKRVLAQYSNPYEETVHVTIRDVEAGVEQVIISNRIHPFFVQRGETSGEQSISQQVQPSSEGHVYRGPIANGFWIDAADLQPGDRLLNADQSWSVVVGVDIKVADLVAFNLGVADYNTFFVSGNNFADAVWVHNNNCIPSVSRVINSNMAHAANDRFARAGFASPREAREALQDLGSSMRRDGLPEGSVMHQFQDDRVFVPVGDGFALYSFNDRGRFTLQTLVTKDMPFQRVIE